MDSFISVNELCVLLSVSAATLNRYVRDGRLPAPSHIKGSRRYWLIDTIRDAIGTLSQPMPIEDRRAGLPVTATAR